MHLPTHIIHIYVSKKIDRRVGEEMKQILGPTKIDVVLKRELTNLCFQYIYARDKSHNKRNFL